MVLMTGLLSLNVHEPLTFDGAEIALHPDLFSPSAGNGGSFSATATGSTVTTSHHRLLNIGGCVGTGTSSLLPQTKVTSVSHEPCDGPMTMNSGLLNTLKPQAPLLQVGDMIEIKVWDLLPHESSSPESTDHQKLSALPRKRYSPIPTSSQSTVPVVPVATASSSQNNQNQISSSQPPSGKCSSNSSVVADPLNSTLAAPARSVSLLEAATNYLTRSRNTPTVQPTQRPSNSLVLSQHVSEETPLLASQLDAEADESTTSSSRNNLIELSIATPFSSPKNSLAVDSNYSKPLPPGMETSAPALPPFLPTGATTPVPAFSASGSVSTALPPKPPSLSTGTRRMTAGTTTSTDLVKTHAPTIGRAALSAPSRPRHFRDLSDMTIDTVYDINNNNNITKPVLDGSHPITEDLCAATAAKSSESGAFVPYQNRNSGQYSETTQQEFTWDGVGTDSDDDADANGEMCLLTSTHRERLSFVMKVSEQALTSLKSTTRTHVSLLRPLADLYNLSTYDMVTIRLIEKNEEEECLKSCRADFVLVTIKDQFISRGEMHSFLQDTLIGSWVYEGQRLNEPSRNIQAHSRQIRHQDIKVPSGIITENTKITFRSRSARFVWLVQMSSEMWEYTSPHERNHVESMCETYFDKWISFVRRLFDKWKEVEVTHSLTVVFFSRTFIGESPPMCNATTGSHKKAKYPSKDHDIYGRHFEDHFRIVLENETSSDWDNAVILFKEAFVRYSKEVGWNLASGRDARRPSSASQGNLMEAINVTLNLLQFHYFDRDLHRTGNSIVVISAGNGVFEVDKGLAAITYERMMVNGIGSDMLSLALPPLHTAPFFLYVSDSTFGISLDFGGTYFEVPHWMHLSFVSYNSEERFVAIEVTSQPENESTSLMNLNGQPLFANGFLLPRMININSGASSDTDLHLQLAIESNESLNKKPMTQTQDNKQLISGRDFYDILEACRPLHAAVLPAALQAVLRLYEMSTSSLFLNDRDDTNTEIPGLMDVLPEWGSLELDAASDCLSRHSHHMRVVALGQEPAVDISPSLGPHLAPDLGQDDAVASVTSSYASQQSSCLAVFSFDRPLLSGKVSNSPTLSGFVMQKSTPLDLLFNDLDSSASDDIRSLMSIDSSLDGKHSDRENKQSNDFVVDIAKQMREFDARIIHVESPKLNSTQGDGKHQSLSYSGNLMHNQLSNSRFGNQSGGIGAALTLYGIHGSKESLKGAPSLSFVASSTKLSAMGSSRIPLPEMTSSGMSPLVLPPGILSNSESPALNNDHHRTLEDCVVSPQVVSRSRLKPFRHLNSRTPTIVTPLSRSPPIMSGSGPAMTITTSSSFPRQGTLLTRNFSQGLNVRMKSKTRQKKAFNPFRQQDEDEVLAKKSHNRRRWSHVFPLGEVEFKKYAGPNWKSLSSPAILPIFVDYFPSQQEINHSFTFSYYNITLSEFDESPYSSNKDFLMEMVRQRLTQDYQLVSPSHINLSTYNRQPMNRSLSLDSVKGDTRAHVTRQFLSMGHRLQVLAYDQSLDVIEVTLYDAKTTRDTIGFNSYLYHYNCFCQETQTFSKVVQRFEKYADPYNWNKVDRILCGDGLRELREGMRFKRLMFAVIPDNVEDQKKESQYIAKFHKLLDYLDKLRDRGDDSSHELNIKIVSNAGRNRDPSIPIESTVGVERDGMKRFYVKLQKGKQDKLEWMEIVVDATCSTLWSYRIMFQWLVAGSAKVETQVQLLQRRCVQFGLALVPIPESSVSKNIYIGPFKAPAVIAIRDKAKVALLFKELDGLDFLHDGIFYTDARIIVAECMENGHGFDFGKHWSRPSVGRQFIHRSGVLFIRVLIDLNGLGLIVVIGNYLYISKDPQKLQVKAQTVFHQLLNRVQCHLNEKIPSSPSVANELPESSTQAGDSHSRTGNVKSAS